MTPHTAGRLRLALVVVVVLVLQTSFAGDLRILGVAPDLLLLLAVAGGLVGGPETGAVLGFVVGLVADLSLATTPIGLQALTWCLVGWGIGTLRANVLQDGRAIQPPVALAATVGALILFLLVGGLVGDTDLTAGGRSFVIRVIAIEGLWSALLVIPATAVLARAARGLPGPDALHRSDPLVRR